LQFENPKRLFTPIGQIRATLMNSWINLLFFFVPAGFVVKYTNRNPVTTFAVNFVAILPLGFMMSYATEELMLRLVGFQSMAVIVAFGYVTE
jgi:Ca2+:H+ antiporter